MPAFNFQGKDYSYANVQIAFMGAPNVPGVTGISFKTKRESENVKGTGDEPMAYTTGSKDYEGSLTVTLGTWKAMCKANNVFSLVDVPAFPIVLALANGVNPTSTITFENVRVTEDGVEGSAGDNLLSVELPIIFTSVNGDWGNDN